MRPLTSLLYPRLLSFPSWHWMTPLACMSCLVITSGTVGQSNVEQLHNAIAEGDITIEAVAGTGGSSGMVIEAYLVNQGPVDQDINVHLDFPIYFANLGEGQNMVATQLYERNGAYLSDGTQSFVRVTANSRIAITFVAYCADFGKDNPTKEDLFTLEDIPPEIHGVVRSIAAAEQASPDADLTVAAQLALWVAQGTSLDAISKRFRFSDHDVAWMHEILRGTEPRHIPQAD